MIELGGAYSSIVVMGMYGALKSLTIICTTTITYWIECLFYRIVPWSRLLEDDGRKAQCAGCGAQAVNHGGGRARQSALR